MANLTTSDLIFSEQANHNFSRTLGELKRSTLSISNRLNSILLDASFVRDVAAAYSSNNTPFSRPLIANERCGSWYISPAHKQGSAYFKSTDGHTSVWKFSTRRLNLQLLPCIGAYGGCIIVDSTRRGKRMPDALSKTVPIWISVMNRALWPENDEAGRLRTPPSVVSEMENAQISARLDSFVQSFVELGLNLDKLRKELGKPMRPLWVTPESQLPIGRESAEDIFPEYHAVILVTSSRRVSGTEVGEGGYVQGSGDDTENWAHGLTPPVFWANKDLLLRTPEGELPGTIARLVAEAEAAKLVNAGGKAKQFEAIPPTRSMRVLPMADLPEQEDEDIYVVLSPATTKEETWVLESPGARILTLGVGTGKLGSRALRSAMPIIVAFIREHLLKGKTRITISCPGGKDLSVGCALALLCLLYDENGTLLPPSETNVKGIDKLFIKKRLTWISNWKPEANPSRSTLQSVNAFLMERQ